MISSSHRWLRSTSNRTFIVWPAVLFAAQAALEGGIPEIRWWGVPLLAWGYLQYRWIGAYRTRRGGGGPGISVPPDRIVDEGPYGWVRNPMYLGHLIFLAGLAAALASWLGAAVLAFHALWFDRRVREDEARLAQRFGEPYLDYCRRVKRWIPGLY